MVLFIFFKLKIIIYFLSWTNCLLKWIEIIFSIIWQLILQPLITFFADYFFHIWELYLLPIVQGFA